MSERRTDVPPVEALGGEARDPAAAARRAIWIAWNPHRRTAGLCDFWGVPLHVLRPTRRDRTRWIELAWRTLALVRETRPEILFVQNPSLALTVLAVLLRPFFGYHLVVDAHNEGIRPFDRPYAVVRWLTRRLLRAADTTIVSNEALAHDVRAVGGRPLVLADRLPVPEFAATDHCPGAPQAPDVVVIATYRADEPIAELMAAAAGMPATRFAFTGDAARYRKTGAGEPPNARLTGYLPDPQYWSLLASARVVCDLTLKPDCLVCGAYEALSLGKPMVLSDNPATREIFGVAAVLAGSTSDEIAQALRTALASMERLGTGARTLRDAYPRRWAIDAAKVRDDVFSRVVRKRSMPA